MLYILLATDRKVCQYPRKLKQFTKWGSIIRIARPAFFFAIFWTKKD